MISLVSRPVAASYSNAEVRVIVPAWTGFADPPISKPSNIVVKVFRVNDAFIATPVFLLSDVVMLGRDALMVLRS